MTVGTGFKVQMDDNSLEFSVMNILAHQDSLNLELAFPPNSELYGVLIFNFFKRLKCVFSERKWQR